MGFGLKQILGGSGAKSGPANPFSLSYKDLDFLKDPAKMQFDDLIANIRAPSSVDAVQGELENERIGELLAGIDEDTERSVAGIKMDALDRGIGGAGQGSDIEFSSLGTARGAGVKAKSGARLAGMMAELERLKNRENAVTGAYGDRYSAGVSGQNSLAQLMAQLYSGGAQRELAGSTPRQPGLLEKMLTTTGVNFAEGAGNALARKAF
jgi:hypothetical protein